MTPRLPAAVRRDQLLDAANDTFGRLGFEATRVEDVAEAAGVAKGLVYRHFASKDALFEALLEREGAAFASGLRAALLGGGGGPEEILQAGLRAWLDLVADDTPSFYFTDPGSHPAYGRMQQGARNVIADVIGAFEPASERPYNDLIAAAVQGAAQTLAVVWREQQGVVPRDDALRLLGVFCWAGLSGLQAEFTASQAES